MNLRHFHIPENNYVKYTGFALLFNLGVTLFEPLLSPFLEARGFLDWQISWMFMVYPLAAILFLPHFGRLSDEIGKRRVIIWGIWMQIFAIILYMIDTYWWVIVGARVLEGLALGMVGVLLIAKIEDSITSQKKRGTATGRSLSWRDIGRIGGTLLGGFLADWYFIEMPFALGAFLLGILSLMLWFTPEDDKITTKKVSKKSTSLFSQMREFLSHKRLRGMAIVGVSSHAAQPALGVFLPLIIVDQLGLTYKAVGFAFFLYSLTHLLQAMLGKWSDKIGYGKGVICGLGFAALLIPFLPYVSSYIALLIMFTLVGVGGSLWNVSAWSLLSDIGEKHKNEGSVLTTYFSIAKVGSLISFFLAGFIAKFIGVHGVFWMTSILLLISLFAAYPYLVFGVRKS